MPDVAGDAEIAQDRVIRPGVLKGTCCKITALLMVGGMIRAGGEIKPNSLKAQLFVDRQGEIGRERRHVTTGPRAGCDRSDFT